MAKLRVDFDVAASLEGRPRPPDAQTREPSLTGQVIPSDGSFIGVPPLRAVIINEDVDDGPDEALSLVPKSAEVLLNPDQFAVKTAAEWARIAVPGLSHEVLQYSHSKSNEINFDLEWSLAYANTRYGPNLYANSNAEGTRPLSEPRLSAEQRDKNISGALVKYRDFLHSLTVPIVRGRAPSRVSIVWPNFLHVTGVVTEVGFTFTQWGKFGNPMAFVASVAMVELRTTFRSRQGREDYFTKPESSVVELDPLLIET